MGLCWLLLTLSVATLTSAAQKDDARVSPRTASVIVTSIRQYFRSDCVYFITSANLGERYHVVSTQRTLGQQRSIFTKVLPYQTLHLVTAKLRSLCNIPIYVMFSDNEDIRDFLATAATKIKLASCVWLLIMMTSQPVDVLFKDAHLPFDTEFIVARQLSEDLVELDEVYRVTRDGPLFKHWFGSWVPGKSMVLPSGGLYERRVSLEGMQVRGADVHYPPVSLLNTTTDNVTYLSGFSGEVWNILEKELNFTTIHKFPQDGSMWGNPLNSTARNSSNVSWDGMIAMILSGEVDVTSSATTMSSERGRAVSFAIPLFTSSFVVYLKKPDRKAVNWTDWAAPFSSRLWAAFIFQTIVSAFLMVGVSWLVRRYGSDEVDLSLNHQLFLMYGAVICQQGQEEKTPMSWSCRILFFIIFVTGVILAASYSGSIISNLTVLRLDLPFSDLEGLLKHGGYSLGMLKSIFIYEIFRSADRGLFQELYKKHVINDPANLITDNFQGFKRVCDKDFAFISNPEAASLWRDKVNCTFVNLPQVFVKYTNSFVLPKNSPYLDLFNNKLLKLLNNGVLRKVYRKYMYKEQPPQQNMFNSIVLEDVTPMLVIVVGGTAAGWLLLALERMIINYLLKHPIPDFSTALEMAKKRFHNRSVKTRNTKPLKNKAVHRRRVKKFAKETVSKGL